MPSIMQRVGTPNPRHNLENEYRKHLDNVDPELSQFNLVISQRSVEEIYDLYLQPAFEAFNARQKRKGRRLDVKWGVNTALEYQRAMDKKARASKNSIDRKGKPPIREIVWQIGNPSQGYGCADQTEEGRKRIFNLLRECQEKAQDRYKQFLWGDAVIHADEVTRDAEDQEHGSIHLHASFVPVCYQNKQGPDVQVAFERCLREMGFESFNAWKLDLDQLMEEVLHSHGLERVVMDNHEKHQSATEFHRQQGEIARTRKLETERANNEVLLNRINSEINRATDSIGQNVYTYIQNLAEEVLSDPANIYEDALFFMHNCSDEQFEDISRRGRELKEDTFWGKMIETGEVKQSLDKTIADITSGKIKPNTLTWNERQEFWEKYNQVSKQFWDMRADLKADYQMQIDKAYKKRRNATRSYYDALYLLRRSRGFISAILCAIWVLAADKQRTKMDDRIEELKSKRAELVRNTASFSQYSRVYREKLKEGKFPGEDCMECMADIMRELDKELQQFRNQKQVQAKPEQHQYLER